MTPAGSLENPILNSPYEPPGEHFVLGPNGPTGEVKVGRRPSESYIPVPVGRRRRGAAQTEQAQQDSLDFDVTGERREVNSLINDIPARVDRWRSFDYPGVTPASRKLLRHRTVTSERRTPALLRTFIIPRSEDGPLSCGQD